MLFFTAATFVSLFNGNDVKGWVSEGPTPAFTVRHTAIQIRDLRQMPNGLRKDREFEFFRFRFEYRLVPVGRSRRDPSAPRPPPFEVWHAAEIELRGPQVRAAMDRQPVQEADVAGHALPLSFIGFPDMGSGDAVRGIEVPDLGAPATLVSLLNGPDLKVWHQRDKGGT
jgi:hypothetical protein